MILSNEHYSKQRILINYNPYRKSINNVLSVLQKHKHLKSNFWYTICDNGYKTCQKVIIMVTWNVEARTICTVGLLCNLEIPLWIISKTCFRHKPLRNFTVICQLDRKYYIPEGLTFCKAIKTYLISFLRNALFKIDFILSACQTNFISPDDMLFIIEQFVLI